MEILGIGMPELIFIFVIAMLVLGPRDMQKAGKTIGKWLNNLINSDAWKVMKKSSLELKNLPTNLMREANLEMRKTDAEIRSAMNSRPSPRAVPVEGNIMKPDAGETSGAQPSAQTDKAPESESLNNA